jgi:hypothetical protein
MTGVATLLIAFRRPEPTRRVLEAIKANRVQRLFVALDAPRAGNASDREGHAAVLDLVRQPGWAPEVRIDVAEHNLGIRERVGSAVTWFLDEAGEGAVLEDDCVPGPSFFPFVAEMLARYRDDERVMQISGSNPVPMPADHRGGWLDYSYSFTVMTYTWGWATWRRAWQLCDLAMPTWPEARKLGLLHALFPDAKWREFWTRKMDGMHAGRRDTWDYSWAYALFAQHGLCVVPRLNLVTNIGDDALATHTGPQEAKGRALLHLPAAELDFPLRHPPVLGVDAEYEARVRNLLAPPRWRTRLRRLHLALKGTE